MRTDGDHDASMRAMKSPRCECVAGVNITPSAPTSITPSDTTASSMSSPDAISLTRAVFVG
jgi:hypothetical protein